jgi:AcrR family transcriptional regulator
MGRTRAALLDGALRGVEKYGTRRLTMADIAMLAGIAKATLYNHFRTKDDLYAALVTEEVTSLARECVALDDPVDALVNAATGLGGHPALRRLASDEPAVLARLATPGGGGSWPLVREAVAYVLERAGCRTDPAAVEVTVRWLGSHLLAPAPEDEVRTGATALLVGLTPGLGR